MHEEQLPVPKHRLKHWTHFAGLYAAEHVAATEFVIGATFVALGAKTMDIILGITYRKRFGGTELDLNHYPDRR